jgi:hypothetical protein
MASYTDRHKKPPIPTSEPIETSPGDPAAWNGNVVTIRAHGGHILPRLRPRCWSSASQLGAFRRNDPESHPELSLRPDDARPGQVEGGEQWVSRDRGGSSAWVEPRVLRRVGSGVSYMGRGDSPSSGNTVGSPGVRGKGGRVRAWGDPFPFPVTPHRHSTEVFPAMAGE